MKNVMFVCLGNICRSPVGEAVFRHLVEERGLSSKYSCDSSGTSAFHEGADPDPRMGITAEKHGVPMDHKAQQFTKTHYESFDVIIAMDRSNYQGILSTSKTVYSEIRFTCCASLIRKPNPHKLKFQILTTKGGWKPLKKFTRWPLGLAIN